MIYSASYLRPNIDADALGAMKSKDPDHSTFSKSFPDTAQVSWTRHLKIQSYLYILGAIIDGLISS